MTMSERMGSKWNFDGFNRVDECLTIKSRNIGQLWNQSRDTDDVKESASLEAQARGESRSWRRYTQAAESAIESDEFRLRDYEKMADVLSTIGKEDREESQDELFKVIDAYCKGWMDYSGNYRDSDKFGRLNDYLLFRELISIYGHEYTDMFESAGL